MSEDKFSKEYTVLIKGIGKRTVMSYDIDGAYFAAMRDFGCKIDDVLAVFGGPLSFEKVNKTIKKGAGE